jgi:hypothetical protein
MLSFYSVMSVLDMLNMSPDGLVELFICCCIGIKLPSLRNSSMLLLLFFMLPLADATCQVCFGGAEGCTDKGAATCPWTTGVAANVAAVVAAVGTAIKLDSLLPARYLRLFTRSVLQTLAIIAAKPKGGATFNFSGKTYVEIHQAVVGGLISKDEGVNELISRLNTEEAKVGTDKNDILCKQLERGIGLCQKAVVKVASTEVTEGAFLFILSKLSTVICGNAGTFDLCVECGDDGEQPATSSTKRFAASLKRPATIEQMYSLVHQFQLVCVTAGFVTVMTISPFLDEVIFEPLRLGVLEWPVAFELMIVYLRMIENEPVRWNIANVVSASGGMDAKRAEAHSMAKGLYSATFFRRPRGEPRDDKVKPDSKSGTEVFKGTVSGHNENGNKGCAAWNNGTSHLVKHVDASTGKCKFRHACNQFVTDKGPGGQCLKDHKRGEGCTYDESKKCSQPQK